MPCLDLSVGGHEAPVQLVVPVIISEHGREDLVPDARVGVPSGRVRVAHGDVVPPARLLQVGDVHVVGVAVGANHEGLREARQDAEPGCHYHLHWRCLLAEG